MEFPICHKILHQPIQLACGNVVCASCCKQFIHNLYVHGSESLCCPCCHPFTPNSIQAPSKVLLNILDGLMITCTKCNNAVRARHHTAHLDADCKEYTHPIPTHSSTISPTPEERVSTIVRRMLSESKDGATLSLSTSGKVRSYTGVHGG